jgi:predicted HTH domain antitoxin
MSQIVLEVPEKASEALNIRPEQVGSEVLLAAAVKFYEVGRLSSGAAAELAGVSKPLFLQKLGSFQVPIFRLTPEELSEDAANA